MIYLNKKITLSRIEKLLISSAFFFLFLVMLSPSPVLASGISGQNVIQLVNMDRMANGLEALRENSLLDKAAKYKLDDMINHDYFAHNSPQGITPWHWIEKSGYDYKYAGENLAINFSTVESQHKAWMASSTHRKNILNPSYREIGVAVGKGKIDGEESILTVQMFGTNMAVFTKKAEETLPATSQVPAEAVRGEEQQLENKQPIENSVPMSLLPVTPSESKMQNIDVSNPVCQNGICRFVEANNNNPASGTGLKLSGETAWFFVIFTLLLAVGFNTFTLTHRHKNNPFIAANTVVMLLVLTSMILWQI